MVSKGVILVGGPSKGTRMRPLTLDRPKPLLPIAGKVPGISEILLVGFYEDAVMAPFVKQAQREFPNIRISYLPEYRSLGTAGGLYHFRDMILRAPVPEHIFICNIDVCSTFPFTELLEVHNKHRGVGTILGVNVKKETATKYGAIVHEEETSRILHYVEKPDGWISNLVNGGVYVFDKSLFDEIKVTMDEKTVRAEANPLVVLDENLQLEQDVIEPLAAAGKMYVCVARDFWRQIKTAASCVTASSLYLKRFEKTRPDLLTKPSANIVGPVFIDPSATIHPSAKVGPNVAIGPNVVLEEGARVANAILLEGTVLEKHSVVTDAIIGANCRLGQWARVDGLPEPECEVKGKISVSVLASEVQLCPEAHIRSCIVLPSKFLTKNAANQVLL